MNSWDELSDAEVVLLCLRSPHVLGLFGNGNLFFVVVVVAFVVVCLWL